MAEYIRMKVKKNALNLIIRFHDLEHIEQIKEEIETRKKMIQCLQDPNRRISSSTESLRAVWVFFTAMNGSVTQSLLHIQKFLLLFCRLTLFLYLAKPSRKLKDSSGIKREATIIRRPVQHHFGKN